MAIQSSDFGTPKMANVVREMTQVFNSKLTPVIGLAAPQVGHSLRLIAFQVNDTQTLAENGLKEPIPLTFLANPQVTVLVAGGPAEYEFCESVPGYSGLVRRAKRIRVTADDLTGKNSTKDYSGIAARIIQHEVDHLDSVLFTDKIEDKTLRHDQYIGQYEVFRK